MKIPVSCLCLLFPFVLFGQPTKYFQQQANYTIRVALDPKSKTLDGSVRLNYTNNSPDTLHFIWFHLWPNAFKNEGTAFGEQLLQNERTDFYFSEDEKRGYINPLNFSVDGKEAFLQDHPLYIDIAKLVLPEALAPGGSILIETPFHEKIPYLWSRGGYSGDFFSITQWYPKAAVYDKEGWHPMPYLDQGEFYSDFGKYEVSITVPGNYGIAATGAEISSTTHGNLRTEVFHQDNIHDFAWFAAPGLQVDSAEMNSIDNRKIKLYGYFRKGESNAWSKAIGFLKESIRSREAHIGPYPYDVAKVVATPDPFAGGMEYPTIASIQEGLSETLLRDVIDHEAGHNWFYGALASNERMYPWMDEGMNSFYSIQQAAPKVDSNIAPIKKQRLFQNRFPIDDVEWRYRVSLDEKTDQPINTSSEAFSEKNYYLTVYHKTVIWMNQLRQFLGNADFEKSIQAYYEQWKFKHPVPDDFKTVIEETTEKNVDSIFALLDRKGNIQPEQRKQFKVAPFFSFRDNNKFNYLFIAPAVGYNYYDKLMVGLVLHNYTLPEPAFHFFLSPLYATGSKSFTGIGNLGYSFTSYGKLRKVELGISGANFNMDAYTDSTGRKNFMNFSKLVPTIKVTFRNKNPRSNATATLQFKTYFINEQSIQFRFDSLISSTVISYPRSDRYLNQLQFNYFNDRVLYPYRALIKLEQSDDFARIALDATYFFNYKKEGALEARWFAGKFIYLGDKTLYKRFATDRYHLNMTGPNGYEDYTYSDYFLGRNEFQNLPSQQIMIRDGGLKVRTDLLSSKIGKTDNWLTALNLTTSIPKKIDPFSILPIDISLRAFLDVGTYADAWKKDASTGKFLYDAGLQISLVKKLVNVYIPVFYSKVYRDYIKSTIPKQKRFWNTISFSIDIQKFRLKNILDY